MRGELAKYIKEFANLCLIDRILKISPAIPMLLIIIIKTFITRNISTQRVLKAYKKNGLYCKGDSLKVV